MLFAIFFEKIFIFSIFHRGVIDFFMSFCCVGSVDGHTIPLFRGVRRADINDWKAAVMRKLLKCGGVA